MPLRSRSGQESSRFPTISNTRTVTLGERLALAVTRWTGSTAAFSIALISFYQCLVDEVFAEQFSRRPS